MRSMLVNESLRWIAEEKLPDDEEADVLLAVQGLLKDVAAIAVGGQLNDASAVGTGQCLLRPVAWKRLNAPHTSNNLTTFFDGRRGFEASLNSPVTEPCEYIRK